MAQGFKDIQVPEVKEDAGYETIFEKVKEAAGGETKSYLWYRNAIRQYALRINDNQKDSCEMRYRMLWVQKNKKMRIK